MTTLRVVITTYYMYDAYIELAYFSQQ